MIASFFTAVVAFVSAHPYLAYGAVLLLAFSESIPVVGAVVPGTAAILAISALVPSGVVTLWPLLGAATAGAIIGDGLSFWIGHHYHREILGRWPVNRHPDLVVPLSGVKDRFATAAFFDEAGPAIGREIKRDRIDPPGQLCVEQHRVDVGEIDIVECSTQL